jgi:hypothetical protein
MSWENLDLECAEAAREMSNQMERSDPKPKKQDLEGLFTDSAAVLAENGPYALFLYLWSRTTKKDGHLAERLIQQLYKLVTTILKAGSNETQVTRMMPVLAEISRDLDRLLVARKLMMQTLTYLRYHAKTFQSSTEPPAGQRREARPPAGTPGAAR